ncbi:MAG: GntR family transcriptional regulator [Firmicutes bacterium]|nr:GntR family transcriptional regulator [Bacillota bacterium]
MIWLTLDHSLPLINQIYEAIRKQILSGNLTAGYKLPSTRELAHELQVSRNVVLNAYDQLLAEGYLESRTGSGTFIACGAVLEKAHELPNLPPSLNKSQPLRKDIIDFRPANPALNFFPSQGWNRLISTVYLSSTPDCFGYGRPEGRPELRQAIASYLWPARGVKCHPEQIIITNGASQAFNIIAKVLLTPNDQVIVEDPLTIEIQKLLRSTGATLVPVPVDDNGLKTDLIPSACKPKLFFVTPSHQSPLGEVLPIQRRIQLIREAQTVDGYIVEDDYDSEFRYLGQPISSMQGLAPDRVIYVGTFSKVLSPGLRIGYLILPPNLIEQFREAKWAFDRCVPIMNQLTLARFITTGHLRKHIVAMKKIYRERRNTLIQSLITSFRENVIISGDSSGLNLVATIDDTRFDEISSQALTFGIRIYPVEEHSIVKGFHRNKLVLGYGNLEQAQLVTGITRLQQFVQSF